MGPLGRCLVLDLPLADLLNPPRASSFAIEADLHDRADAALAGLREECAHLIGAGKKVVLS
jgi:hypothetical protein